MHRMRMGTTAEHNGNVCTLAHAGFYSAFYQQNDGHFDACRDGGKLTRVLTPTVMQVRA
jgi:hypothetical protein